MLRQFLCAAALAAVCLDAQHRAQDAPTSQGDAGLRPRASERARQEHQGRAGRIRARRLIGCAYPPESAFIYATVLEGAIDSQVNDGPVTMYRAGESWSEQPGDRHAVSENASDTEPARLLAVFVVDTNEKELSLSVTEISTAPRFARAGARRCGRSCPYPPQRKLNPPHREVRHDEIRCPLTRSLRLLSCS